MRKTLIAAAVAVTLAGMPARAADMAFKVAPAAGHDWTGFYVGVNAGYGRSDPNNRITGDVFDGAGSLLLNSVFNVDGIDFNTFPLSNTMSGALGGVQAGFNWQLGPRWVAGVETDIQLSALKGSATVAPGGVVGLSLSWSQQIDWFSTLRGRLGYELTDELLVFATGGLAYGETKASASIAASGIGTTFPPGFATVLTCPGGSVCLAGARSGVSAGWAAGGGLEYAAWRNVTVKLEYLHVDLGSQNVLMVVQAPSTGNATTTARFENAFDLVRGGVNLRF